jgi:hypothetical protein
VYISERSATTGAAAQRRVDNETCEDFGCIDVGVPQPVTVGRRAGSEQLLRHPEQDFTAILTVESESLVVTVVGESFEETEPIVAIMHTLVLRR